MSNASGIVLVVDDDPSICAMLRDAFEPEGLIVHTVENGLGALDVATHQHLDLIVLDLNLPDFRGETIAAALNSRFQGDVPLIIITADPGARERSLGLRACALLRKPLDIDDLVTMVVALTHRRPSKN